ncbi:MAG: aldo/keto reductase [Pseudomonadota bacterium]|jgi:aryl-alcohol dehydrogenase-like predicted oxidoreductase
MRQLGKSDLSLSEVGIGCNNFGGRLGLEESRAVVHKALDLGINFFDTADYYGNRGGSEEYLGKILGPRRNDVVVATKFGLEMYPGAEGASRAYIMSAVEQSLRRLKTDYIDLYQLHWPDPKTPMSETLEALGDLVRSGKVRYIGCSNLMAWQVIDALWISRTAGFPAYVSCQEEYNIASRGIEREMLPAMKAFGLGLVPYSPLASGVLSGKYRRGQEKPPGSRLANSGQLAAEHLSDHNLDVVAFLEPICAATGLTMIEVAISWLLARPVVASVIAGASTPAQVEQNMRASRAKLPAEYLAQIDERFAPKAR